MNDWWVYILDCDGRLYTGISTDPARRLQEHASGQGRAAKFTRTASSLRLEYQQQVGNRSTASKVEAAIKKLSRQEKLALVEENPTTTALLSRFGLE